MLTSIALFYYICTYIYLSILLYNYLTIFYNSFHRINLLQSQFSYISSVCYPELFNDIFTGMNYFALQIAIPNGLADRVQCLH